MIDHLGETTASAAEDAYLLCSLAVDLKISEIVDGGQYIVSALLPEAIFLGMKSTSNGASASRFANPGCRRSLSMTMPGTHSQWLAPPRPYPAWRSRHVALLAGAAGTAAMDALLFVRYRQGGGKSKLEDLGVPRGSPSWDEAPAPAQVGKRLIEGLFAASSFRPSRAPLVNNVTHWALRDPRRRAVRRRRRVIAPAADPLWAAVRSERSGRAVTWSCRQQALQADLGVRPQDAGQGPQRPPCLRPRHRRRRSGCCRRSTAGTSA